LTGKNPAELAPPGPGKIRVGATARGKKEAAVAEIFSEVFQLRFGEHKVVVAVHEEKRRFEQLRIGQPQAALLLNFERGGAGDEAHEVLANPGTIVALVAGTVFDPAQEEGGLFVFGG